MAEASYMSQEAAKKEADNMSRMLWLQEKDLEARKNDADDMRAERKAEFHQQLDERKAQTELIKKMVDKMMPDEDPTEKFITPEHPVKSRLYVVPVRWPRLCGPETGNRIAPWQFFQSIKNPEA
jgi:hypothetical protein